MRHAPNPCTSALPSGCGLPSNSMHCPKSWRLQRNLCDGMPAPYRTMLPT